MPGTIKEVAEKAGVSVTTVSRVINEYPRVRQDTRERVDKVIKELEYVPNVMARGLTLGKTRTIGLILPEIADGFFSQVIKGADEAAVKNNFHLLVSTFHSHRSDEELSFRLMSERRVDGLILMDPTLSDDFLTEFQWNSFPIIVLCKKIKYINCNYIVIDDFQGAYQAVIHLIKHGYKRIAIIGGPSDNYDASQRLAGYTSALKDYNIKLNPGYIVDGNFRWEGGESAMHILLDLANPPDAVFAANDPMAIGAMEAVKKRKLIVPKDIAIVGFDDIELSRLVTPPLTTVHLPMYELGTTAVKSVIRILEGRNVRRRNILKTGLVVRKSCGC
ncbi:MAG: LacI family DNA-binding transcriptional regulator [candidate division WOR-3 bacterium]|nr:LacI family DNA-binding transcriptional regulator [candidate division WOR-3 bacterium]